MTMICNVPGCALAMALLAWLPSALADPMRPLSLPARPASAPAGAAPLAADNPSLQARPAAPELVAIRRDSSGRRQALIGERWLAVGERFDKTTVAAIGDSAVDLVTAGQRATLRLLPPLLASHGAPVPSALVATGAAAAVAHRSAAGATADAAGDAPAQNAGVLARSSTP